MKHVGKYGEKPCVVVFREIPNEPENCLVIMSDGLEDHQHDDLMNVVQSAEGQEAREFSEVLNRRQFTTGENMLQNLHQSNRLTKVPVSMVTLTPTPTDNIALSDVNAEIRKLDNDPIPPVTDPAHLAEPETRVTTAEVEGTPANEAVESDEAGIASNMIMQADLMIEDAERMIEEAKEKKRQAYEMDPSLKPKRGPGRPPKDEL